MKSRGVAVIITCRGGQAKLCQQIANPQKFLGSFRYLRSANFYKILPNSLKTVRTIYALFVRRYSMYLQTCGCFKSAKIWGLQIENPQITNSQITKEIGFANPQSVTFVAEGP
jgi:hypothetical protein